MGLDYRFCFVKIETLGCEAQWKCYIATEYLVRINFELRLISEHHVVSMNSSFKLLFILFTVYLNISKCIAAFFFILLMDGWKAVEYGMESLSGIVLL